MASLLLFIALLTVRGSVGTLLDSAPDLDNGWTTTNCVYAEVLPDLNRLQCGLRMTSDLETTGFWTPCSRASCELRLRLHPGSLQLTVKGYTSGEAQIQLQLVEGRNVTGKRVGLIPKNTNWTPMDFQMREVPKNSVLSVILLRGEGNESLAVLDRLTLTPIFDKGQESRARSQSRDKTLSAHLGEYRTGIYSTATRKPQMQAKWPIPQKDKSLKQNSTTIMVLKDQHDSNLMTNSGQMSTPFTTSDKMSTWSLNSEQDPGVLDMSMSTNRAGVPHDDHFQDPKPMLNSKTESLTIDQEPANDHQPDQKEIPGPEDPMSDDGAMESTQGPSGKEATESTQEPSEGGVTESQSGGYSDGTEPPPNETQASNSEAPEGTTAGVTEGAEGQATEGGGVTEGGAIEGGGATESGATGGGFTQVGQHTEVGLTEEGGNTEGVVTKRVTEGRGAADSGSLEEGATGGIAEGGATEGGVKEVATEEGTTEGVATEEGVTDVGATKVVTQEATEAGATEGEATEEGAREGGVTHGGATEGEATEDGARDGGVTHGGATEEGATEGVPTEGGATEGGGVKEDGVTEGGATEGTVTDGPTVSYASERPARTDKPDRSTERPGVVTEVPVYSTGKPEALGRSLSIGASPSLGLYIGIPLLVVLIVLLAFLLVYLQKKGSRSLRP